MGREVLMSYDAITPTRLRCSECGREGPDTHGLGWQYACERGHLPCPECGHVNPVHSDGRPRLCVGRGARNRGHRR